MIDKSKRFSIGRWIAFSVCICLLAGYGLYTMKVNMGSAEIQEVSGYKPVDKDLLAEIESLPIQSGGRTKPYVTWAKYLMYSLHGSSTIKFKSNGDTYKLDASEVVFQSLFFPEFTNQLELFRIEDKLILSSLNVENEKANNQIQLRGIRGV